MVQFFVWQAHQKSYTVNRHSQRWNRMRKIIGRLVEQALFKLISILLNDLVGDARIIALHRTLEHDFPFPHFEPSHAIRSLYFFYFSSDHYAFSSVNNQTKSYLTFAIWSDQKYFGTHLQYHIRLKSKPFCYHSRAYAINFFLDLLAFGIVVTLMIS